MIKGPCLPSKKLSQTLKYVETWFWNISEYIHKRFRFILLIFDPPSLFSYLSMMDLKSTSSTKGVQTEKNPFVWLLLLFLFFQVLGDESDQDVTYSTVRM